MWDAVKNMRIWKIWLAGVALSVLPEYVEGQHRAGTVAMWLSAFPRSKQV